MTTRMILRRWRDTGDLIALMPDIDEGPGLFQSYMRIGQHGAASRGVVDRTRPVDPTDDDAVALLRELRSIGYEPVLIRRLPHRRR
jgi:hypothetical protein